MNITENHIKENIPKKNYRIFLSINCVSPTAVHSVGERVKVFKVIKDDDYELLYLTGKGYYSHHYSISIIRVESNLIYSKKLTVYSCIAYYFQFTIDCLLVAGYKEFLLPCPAKDHARQLGKLSAHLVLK